jgi:uncharacterized flavoprotein (TIGR03862 family)
MQIHNNTHSTPSNTHLTVAIIGAGPAGLMAAEVISAAGFKVHVYDSKASAARKFLLAGVGGMNITHAEDWPLFISRYGEQQQQLQPILQAFTPQDLRHWIHALGIKTFVGSSGRVFPSDMKAAPLLRAWLHRLRQQGVEFFMRHRCLGWQNEQLVFATNDGEIHKKYAAIVLALGGGSWPQLGSDGAWQTWLSAKNIQVKPLLPANCGFNVAWSDHLKQGFSGSPIKNAVLTVTDQQQRIWKKRGEFIISNYGIEGSAVYALSAPIRDILLSGKTATLNIDLASERHPQEIETLLSHKRKGMSLGNVLRKKLNLTAAEVALLHECLDKNTLQNPLELAQAIKNLPIIITSTRPLSEAISSAGGIDFSELTEALMLKKIPGIFCAGEMLNWEAPTGGYLLSACFATGRTAGQGVTAWLNKGS